MKLSALLDRLRAEKDLAVEERTLANHVQQFVVYTLIPFPKNHWEWYVFTLPRGVTAEQYDIKQWQIDAMLRHLWMFQLDIGDESEAEEPNEEPVDAEALDPPPNNKDR